ncbi:hypothetical protein FKW50_08560, partial [Acetobacter pomorum]|uniref:hypothetical protein n=1 Tax=Acetobacter pomorum TaxID=65959 RepID=UPI00128AA891
MMDSPANDPEMQKLIAMEVADIMKDTTAPTNWPDPNRPGVPMFPERDGAHAIQVPDLEETEIVYYWHQNGGGWTEYNHQDAEDFLTDEDMKGWIYKGPIVTPTQINEMLAAER